MATPSTTFTQQTGREAGRRSGRSRRDASARRRDSEAVVTVVERLVAELPPLPDDLRRRLGVLLGGGGEQTSPLSKDRERP